MLLGDFLDCKQDIPKKGVVLSLDWGKARIGLAATDPFRRIAFPIETVDFIPEDRFWLKLKKIADERKVQLVVLGLPRRTDGKIGKSERTVRGFALKVIQRLMIPTVLYDESFTTSIARTRLTEIGKLDMRKLDETAALVLLQDFISAIQK